METYFSVACREVFISEKFIAKEKIKVYELAKALGKDSFFLLDQLKSLGIEVGNHMSSLSPEQANRAIATLKKRKVKIASAGKSLLSPKEKAPNQNEVRILVLSEHLRETRDSMIDQRHRTFSKRKREYLKAQNNDRAKKLDRAKEDFAKEPFSLAKLKKGMSLVKTFTSQIGTEPEKPEPEAESNREQVICAGLEGEASVRNVITKVFDGRSFLLCGFLGGYGEVDFILIGPGGVIAIEVKRQNGTVSCNGDDWWYDKFDSNGKKVGSKIEFADRRGRSPSVQLNEIADSLERALCAVGIDVKVRRLVVLADKKSKIGRLKNVTVDEVLLLEKLGHSLQGLSSKTGISPERVERIAREIQELHERFAANRRTKEKLNE